ncbi:hypothetical protein Slala03_42800 [Streptomyces lavendulae subsp. lavendulae]|nr:hypothetical protein Slala03_42800 [Streptomyces lavendulae subsp. lavendulae]
METARSWVEGWAVARRAPRPVDVPWGLRIDIGQPAQAVRHVLLDTDAETARGLIGTITEPTTCVKASSPRATWSPGSPQRGSPPSPAS